MFRLQDYAGDFRYRSTELVIDSNGWYRVVPADLFRATLIITPTSQSAIRLVTAENTGFATGQIIIPAGTTYVIEWARFGAWTTLEFWGRAISGAVIQPTGITEILWEP